MRAKMKNPENPERSIVNAIGNAENAVKKICEVTGQIPGDNIPGTNGGQNVMSGLQAVETGQPAGTYEIAPGMTVEEMTAIFFNGALIEPPYKIWQLNSKGHRYYYKFDDDGTPEFYPSVTTILSQTLPKSEFLIKWIADKGIEEADRYKAERAAYGTFMHAQFEELIINRNYDLDGLKDKLKNYIKINRLPADFIYYAGDLKKDVLAFAQFVMDYDVRPLAVEIALVHPIYNYAGMIDLLCTMLVKPGAKERINAIVDFKSGRKGFYEEMEIQLYMYKMMWEANFPDMPITRIYNFSPKDWHKKPTYNLKDQTNSPNADKIPYLLGLAAVEDAKRDNTFTAVFGEISLDNEPDLKNNIVSLTLAELVKSKAPAEKNKPEPGKAVTVEDLTQKDDSENTENVQKTGNSIHSKQEPEPEPQTEQNVISCEKFIGLINNDDYNYSLWQTTDIGDTYGVKLVDEGLNLDQHRWYSIATNIYECSDGFVKVTGAFQSFSEKQSWSDIDVHSEAEKLQGKELQAFELRMKAYEIENATEQQPEPEPQPEPEEKKTKTVKRTTRKTAKTAENKPIKEKKTAKRTITPKKEKVAKIEEKQPKKPEPVTKKDLLNTEIDI